MLETKLYAALKIGLVLLLAYWAVALCVVPSDLAQGEFYRIIYLHVPAAFSAFWSAFVLMVLSILALKSKDARWSLFSKASAEVGLIFAILTLATGSIWGRPVWGTWWTWDARLTTTLLLAILYGGWLFLYNSLPQGPSRLRGCAVLGLMIAADVPIIYKSVTWWRTLHQPQTIIRAGGSTMDSEMLVVLVSGIFLMTILASLMMYVRGKNLQLMNQLDEQTMRSLP